MSWIELHQSAPRHPKILSLSHILGLAPAAGLGHVVTLWLWALDYAEDGDLSGHSPAILAQAVGLPPERGEELLSAMRKVRLLDDGCTIHDWDDYAGRVVAYRRNNRKLSRERMRRYRKSESGLASVTHDVTRNKTNVTHDVTRNCYDVTPTTVPTVPTYLPTCSAAAPSALPADAGGEKGTKAKGPTEDGDRDGDRGPTVRWAEFLEAFNASAARAGWHSIAPDASSETRKRALRVRARNAYWREHWREALVRVESWPWGRGEGRNNEGAWKMDADYFLRVGEVERIMEGKRDGAPKPVETHWNMRG